MSDEAGCDLPIQKFRPGIDSLDDFFQCLELSVDLVHNLNGEVDENLLKKWLPLKLDAATYSILKNCDLEAEWEDLKAELKSLLVTQQDRYRWRSGQNRVKWDGHESLHMLASRVQESVDMHEDEPRESDYFFNFRNALPPPYQAAIDLRSEKETMESAKTIALKFQVATATQGDPSRAPGGVGVSHYACLGAMRSDHSLEDRLSIVEEAVANLSSKVDKLVDVHQDLLRDFEERRFWDEQDRQHFVDRPRDSEVRSHHSNDRRDTHEDHRRYHDEDNQYYNQDRHGSIDRRHHNDDRRHRDDDRCHRDEDRHHHDADRRHHDEDRLHRDEDRYHHDNDRRHDRNDGDRGIDGHNRDRNDRREDRRYEREHRRDDEDDDRRGSRDHRYSSKDQERGAGKRGY